MKLTPELIRRVADAIGNIPTRNTGVIGYAAPLRSEISSRMIDRIAQTAIEAIPEPPESADG
jgi:hypothetical protein